MYFWYVHGGKWAQCHTTPLSCSPQKLTALRERQTIKSRPKKKSQIAVNAIKRMDVLASEMKENAPQRGGFFFLNIYIYIYFINLFIYFWLCWVFVSVWGLSPVVASGGHSSSRCAGLSLSRPIPLRSTGSRRAGSVVVAHRPSRCAACGIFPDQGTNPCSLHWQADS